LFPGGESLLEEGDRLVDPAAVPIGGGKVAAGVQGAGMVGAQQSLSYRQVQLVQLDRLGGPPCVLVGAGEIVLRGEGLGITGAKRALPHGQDLLEQRDRLGDPAGRQVGGCEAVPRVQGVGMVRPQDTLKILGQRLADRDGQRRTVTQFEREIERDEPEPQQHPGQLFVDLCRGLGQALQQRRHLLEDSPDGPAIRGSHLCSGVHVQHEYGSLICCRQPPSAGQPVTDHPRYQAVHDDSLAIQAKGQERPAAEPFQDAVDQARRYQPPAAGQYSRLPGRIQQLAVNPGRRQARHDLHDPGADACPIGRPDRVQR
jgi:hypothetical protein